MAVDWCDVMANSTNPLPPEEHQVAIISTLTDGQPRTAAEILGALWSPPDRNTVYRYLRWMANAGLLHKSQLPDVGQTFFYSTRRNARRLDPLSRNCKVCGISKPLDAAHFANKNDCKNPRLSGVCRDCEAVRIKRWADANREKQRANRRDRHKTKEAEIDPQIISDERVISELTDRGTRIVRFTSAWKPTPNRRSSAGFADGSSLNRIDL